VWQAWQPLHITWEPAQPVACAIKRMQGQKALWRPRNDADMHCAAARSEVIKQGQYPATKKARATGQQYMLAVQRLSQVFDQRQALKTAGNLRGLRRQ